MVYDSWEQDHGEEVVEDPNLWLKVSGFEGNLILFHRVYYKGIGVSRVFKFLNPFGLSLSRLSLQREAKKFSQSDPCELQFLILLQMFSRRFLQVLSLGKTLLLSLG